MLTAAPAAKSTFPPFSIKSDKMEAYTRKPYRLIYTGNVKLTSPLYNTVMTCDKLTANALSQKDVSEITAAGDVDVKMVLAGKAGESNKNIHATAQKTTYDGQRLRLMTDKGTRPVFVMTDAKTKEKLMDLTGDEIVYDLKDLKINVVNPRVNGGGED